MYFYITLLLISHFCLFNRVFFVDGHLRFFYAIYFFLIIIDFVFLLYRVIWFKDNDSDEVCVCVCVLIEELFRILQRFSSFDH